MAGNMRNIHIYVFLIYIFCVLKQVLAPLTDKKRRK